MDFTQTIELVGVSFISWFFSVVLGGGSPLLLIPFISWLLGLEAVAPVLTLGLLIGNSQRMFLFQQELDFPSSGWFIPGSIVGTFLGAWLLQFIQLEGLQCILGLSMVLTAIYCGLVKSQWNGPVKVWYFFPVALFSAVLSSLVGSSGSLTNPLYLSYGLSKGAYVGTKSLHTSALHLIKILAYVLLGLYQPEYWIYGGIIGISSFPANWLGKQCLQKMTVTSFTQAVLLLMALSGSWMIWTQRGWMLTLSSTGSA